MAEANVLTDDVAELLISLRMKSQVDKLLRDAKEKNPDNKEVRVSGTTKELVEENLRRAIAAGVIPIESVWNAVTEFEESKPHHRLYYTVADADALAVLADVKQVRTKLLGVADQPAHFPDLKTEPIGERWADFRELADGWRAKMYRGGDRWVLNPEQSKEEPDRRVKVWTREYARDVWCITWYRSKQMLVLQFPPHDIKADYHDSFQGIRTIASKVVALDKLEPFPITRSVIALIDSYAKIKDQVRIVVADLGSAKQGRALLATRSDTEHMVDDENLAAAVKLFSEANEATIIWLPTQATDAIKEETRTVIGKRGTNNVQFTAVSTPVALEYICNELVKRTIA